MQQNAHAVERYIVCLILGMCSIINVAIVSSVCGLSLLFLLVFQTCRYINMMLLCHTVNFKLSLTEFSIFNIFVLKKLQEKITSPFFIKAKHC